LFVKLIRRILGALRHRRRRVLSTRDLLRLKRCVFRKSFSGRVHGLASGIVQRRDRNEVLVDIGRAQAVLPYSQQSRLDNYTFRKHMRFYILKVDQRDHHPVIIISRSDPGLVRRLFEQEVPEIGAGIVEIVNIAREAGRGRRCP